jgi:hypothetical protein
MKIGEISGSHGDEYKRDCLRGQCFSNGGPRTPEVPQGWAKGFARLFNCFVFLKKKYVK